jgi:hypothetical protein
MLLKHYIYIKKKDCPQNMKERKKFENDERMTYHHHKLSLRQKVKKVIES